jgi:uncharacterized cupredoxin-like copper-binding protein
MRHRAILLLVFAALAAVGFAACGDDDDDGGATESAGTETTTPAGSSGGVTIEMGDYFFQPKDAAAKAGSVTIDAPNIGQVEHELVLFKTNADPASLPLSGSDVDEAALEKSGAEEGGEIEEVGPGESEEGTFDLTPGKYVMFCNLPGHYERGMYGSLTVK